MQYLSMQLRAALSATGVIVSGRSDARCQSSCQPTAATSDHISDRVIRVTSLAQVRDADRGERASFVRHRQLALHHESCEGARTFPDAGWPTARRRARARPRSRSPASVMPESAWMVSRLPMSCSDRSAPCWTSSWTTSLRPLCAAPISAVRPSSVSCAFTSAPRSSSNFTASSVCCGDHSYVTPSTQPMPLATISGVTLLDPSRSSDRRRARAAASSARCRPTARRAGTAWRRLRAATGA